MLRAMAGIWAKRVAAALVSAWLTGCVAPPIGTELCRRPETDEPIDYVGGDVENGVYRSADPYGELLHFPGGAFYRLHHELGEQPRWWQFYVSFERNGLTDGSVALAAGNQAELKAIDDETITVVNASCAEYWLLAVAGTGDEP